MKAALCARTLWKFIQTSFPSTVTSNGREPAWRRKRDKEGIASAFPHVTRDASLKPRHVVYRYPPWFCTFDALLVNTIRFGSWLWNYEQALRHYSSWHVGNSIYKKEIVPSLSCMQI